MTGPGIDPAEFKATQREAWGAAAEGWSRWRRIFEAGAQGLNELLVDLADVRSGHRVLDVATGIGEPALTAARRVGEAGSVLATDLAPPMLAVARDRASERGLLSVAFHEMDAERLDLEPGSFDAATCRWALMLLLDPFAAARGVRSALKDGGRFAAAVWAEPERVPFLAIPHEVAARVLALPDPPPGSPGAFALGRPGQLEAVLERAGFRDVRSVEATVAFDFASPGEYASFLLELSGTLRKALAERPEEVRERVRAEVEHAVAPRADAVGRLRLENVVRCVSAAR